MQCFSADDRELSRFSVKFSLELSHKVSESHILLSSVDPGQGGGAGCRRVEHLVCLALLITCLLMLTLLWYGLVQTAPAHDELTTARSSMFRSSDAAVALCVAFLSFLPAALLLEIFHCNETEVSLA